MVFRIGNNIFMPGRLHNKTLHSWLVMDICGEGVPVTSKINYKLVFTFFLKQVPVCKSNEHNLKFIFLFENPPKIHSFFL